MTELLQWLYQYITEHLCLDDPEYKDNRRHAASHYDALMDTLTHEQKDHLSSWQDEHFSADAIEREAMFRAALSMGLELGGYTMRSL